MLELDRRESKDYRNKSEESQAARHETVLQLKKDHLLLAILATTIGLAALVIGIAVFWGSGPVLAEASWYIPLISSFVSLTTLTIAFVAFGRFHVLRDPVSFWVGSGFAVYGIGQIFYALSWPGLLAEGRSVLGNLPNTSSIIVLTSLSILIIFLLAAVLVSWPGRQNLPGNRWLWAAVVWVLFAVAVYSLILRFETYLPIFVDESGVFTSALRIWAEILLITFAAGSIFSTLFYRRSGDRLAGLIVFPQLALMFFSMMVLIGGKRYDLWWYVQRVVLAGGHLIVLFGLLYEYIRLLQQASEEQHLLEAILENIPVGLAVTGGPPTFPITRMSRHGLAINQSQVEGLIGESAENTLTTLKILLPGEERQPAPEQLPLYRASQFGEEVHNTELVVETRDGQRIPVLVNAAPIHDVQGNVVAAISTWLDITDRKRAEETLKASEALYRAIARSIPRGGIFVVDKDLRYIIAEGTITEKFGISKETVEGHTVSEVFDNEIAARMEARFRRAFEGETISYETEHNGRIYWTQHAVMDDLLGHVIVVTLDITERKLAEKALSESEQRFRAIINQSTAGILRSDVEGRAVFVNQAFCDLLGYSESELIGEKIWQLTHPEDQEESRRLFDHLSERGRPFQLEERLVHRDGSILWVNVSASPILDEVDRPQSAVFIVVDITERKQAEQDLQELNLQLENRVQARTLELQTANWALSESRRRLQVLSQRIVDVQEDERRAIARELHDRVGQTLTALNLNLTIVNDQLANQSISAVSDRLADSIKLVTEMIAIVRDVMSDLRPVVLDEYGLEAALQAYLTKFEERYRIGVEFSRSSRRLPQLGAGMEMTVLRITQEALLNIARHAHADHVSLSLQYEDNAILLTIEDNGVGIEAWQDTNRLNGHGLMLMRERAEAVGGTLKINSILSKGTRIDAYLPFQNDGKYKPEKEGGV
jgi:PAS domain S-box-containing protein